MECRRLVWQTLYYHMNEMIPTIVVIYQVCVTNGDEDTVFEIFLIYIYVYGCGSIKRYIIETTVVLYTRTVFS